jgi:hypothetical protein
MEQQLSVMLVPASGHRFDQELMAWFAPRGGPWSGTASELLAAVKTTAGVGNDSWPQSPLALYPYIESHREILRSFGVDAVLHHGYPRMVSLRSCLDERPAGESSSGIARINRSSDPTNLAAFTHDQKWASVDYDQVSPTRDETFSQDMPPAKSDVISEDLVNGIYAEGNDFEGSIFESTGEALFARVEMGVRIREQGLDLKSAIDLVVGRTQEITRSCGVAVGLLQQDSVVYAAGAGVAATIGGLHFQANLFQSCRRTGRTLQLRDAQKHPSMGAMCRREGIGSLIIVPIFCQREVTGAIELLFRERRSSFSTGDVMDLELIAGVISQSFSAIQKTELKQVVGRECLAETNAAENIESQVRDSVTEKTDLVHVMASPFPHTTDAQRTLWTSATPESMVLSLLASKLAAAPTLLWLAFKRAWMSTREGDTKVTTPLKYPLERP